MKANITNLRKVLKICARAHNTTFHNWSGEGHFSIHSETPGTICDVEMILDSFYGRHDMIEVSWGYVVIWLEEMMYGNKDEVNIDQCLMALPYGTELN